MKMSFTKAMELLKWCLIKNKVCMITGSPGTAKTQGSMAVYEELGIPLTYRTPSTLETVDYNGLPKHSEDGSRVQWSMPDFVAELWDNHNRTGKCGLLYDEANTVSMAQQVPLMQMTLERRSGSHPLPPSCRITLAGNFVKDRAAAQRMGTALNNRLWHAEIEGIDVDAWLKWAVCHDIAPEIIAFVRLRREAVLYKTNLDPDEKAFYTFRSVADCSDAVSLPDSLRMVAIASRVGEQWATEFEGFLRVYREMGPHTVANILRDPYSVDVFSNSSLQYAVTVGLSKASNAATFGNALTYAGRMSAEMEMVLATDAIARHPELVNTAAYIAHAARNSNILV